ncbi:MAG: hypothetical protein ACRCSV_00160 [Chlamydiales bacterium]
MRLFFVSLINSCIFATIIFAQNELPLENTLINPSLTQPTPITDTDWKELKAWIKQQQISIREKGGILSFSGDVRTELQSTHETKNGVRQRGSSRFARTFPTRNFDIEVNLMFDYRADRTWALVKIEFDNTAGIFTGTFDRVRLEKAYFGARLLESESYSADIEIGRRCLMDVYDSRIQFGSIMDGLVFKYANAYDRFGDFYIYGGGFVTNQRRNHYGIAVELGVLDLWDSGLYVKYSLIDWDTKGFHSDARHRMFRFTISQGLVGYKFSLPQCRRPVIIYTAGLLNHKATDKPLVVRDGCTILKKIDLTNHTKANWAYYMGFSVGELRKPGDWSIDVNYQWVAAQAIPSFDVSGIGRGNAERVGFYTMGLRGEGGANTRKNAVGSTNYKGLAVDFLYVITNNLTMSQSYRQSINLNKTIGPAMKYKQYEIEFIYAF